MFWISIVLPYNINIAIQSVNMGFNFCSNNLIYKKPSIALRSFLSFLHSDFNQSLTKIGELLGIKSWDEITSNIKIPGLYFCGPIVSDLRGIVVLLVDQMTLFLLLCYSTKFIRPLESLFIKRFHFEFDLVGFVLNLFNNFFALFTFLYRCTD
jgi:hypothetical protein